MGERADDVDIDDVDIDDVDTLSLVDDEDDLIEEVGDDLDIAAELSDDLDNDGKNKPKKFDDDEAEEYGKKVQRRINKEVQKRKVLEDRLANQEADYERRMSEFEERFNAQDQENETASISDKLEDVESRRKEDREVGDYDQELEDEWFELKSKQRESKKKQNRKPEKKGDPDDANNNADAGRAENPPLPEEQKKWLDSNKWYGQNKSRSDYANREYQLLVSEGYDPDDPDIYEELDMRMSGKAPANTDDNVDTGNDERDERPPPPARPNRGDGNRNRKKAVFTNADKAKMQEWNLDPSDPVARKAWLAEKRSA